jgi:MATE family multidrug resistance protein
MSAFDHVTHSYVTVVWGPEPIRLGFIGAPIATSISYNLVSIASVVYGVFFVEKTAWHPLSRRCFTSLGLLVQLGLGGVGEYRGNITHSQAHSKILNLGQVASEWWSWELIGRAYIPLFVVLRKEQTEITHSAVAASL